MKSDVFARVLIHSHAQRNKSCHYSLVPNNKGVAIVTGPKKSYQNLITEGIGINGVEGDSPKFNKLF